jgi:hypothetical protein
MSPRGLYIAIAALIEAVAMGALAAGLAFLLLVVIVTYLVTGGFLRDLADCATDATRNPASIISAASEESIPSNYLALYRRAGREWNVPWNILAGIGYQETRHGTSQLPGVHSGENYKHAAGPMQFIPATFEWVKEDGNHDGERNRYDPADAIFSAARLLKTNGLPGASRGTLKTRALNATQMHRALRAYNNSEEYVQAVLATANRYARSYTEGSANYAGLDCGPVGDLIEQFGSIFGVNIAHRAAFFVYTPVSKKSIWPPLSQQVTEPVHYAWGGGNIHGVSYGIGHGSGTRGFDCSGLVQYAVYQASNGKITLPRTTYAMWAMRRGGSSRGLLTEVSRERLAPGDLLFFNGGGQGPGHVGIYYGEYRGARWMVEAQQTGTDVMFSDFDARLRSYVGALRVAEPVGWRPVQALSGSGADPAGRAA